MEELLTKYFTGEITRQEKELLFEAMNTDEALRKEFYALQNTIALTGCLEEEADRDYGSQSYSQFKKRLFCHRMLRQLLHSCKYAAMIAVVASCVYFLTRYQMNETLSERYTEISAP